MKFAEKIRSSKKKDSKAPSSSTKSDDGVTGEKDVETNGEAAATKSEAGEAYHGQVLQRDSDQDSGSDSEWHAVKLKFKKHVDDGYRNRIATSTDVASDGRLANDYAVIDPRKLR